MPQPWVAFDSCQLFYLPAGTVLKHLVLINERAFRFQLELRQENKNMNLYKCSIALRKQRFNASQEYSHEVKRLGYRDEVMMGSGHATGHST